MAETETDLSRNRYNGLAPNRAHDVVYYLRLMEITGEPPPYLVDQVRDLIRHGTHDDGGERNPMRVFPVNPGRYEKIALRLGWHRGGSGDHLAKAIAIVESEIDD